MKKQIHSKVRKRQSPCFKAFKKVLGGLSAVLFFVGFVHFGEAAFGTVQSGDLTAISIGGVDLGGSINIGPGGVGGGINIGGDGWGLGIGGGTGGIPGGGLSVPDSSVYEGIPGGELKGKAIEWTNYFLGYLGLAAMIALIYAGFMYLTGSEGLVEKAKKLIIWIVVGIILILLAYAIVNTLIVAGQGEIVGGDGNSAPVNVGNPVASPAPLRPPPSIEGLRNSSNIPTSDFGGL